MVGKAERLTWHKAWTMVSTGFSISYTSSYIHVDMGIGPPCRAPVPCGNPPTLPRAGAVWESAHLAARRCRVGIRPPCRAPVLCGNPPTLPGAGAVWKSAHLAGRRCRVGIRPPYRAPVLCGNPPIFMTKICQMTGSCVLIYVRRDFAYQLLRTEIFLNHQYYT